MNKQKWISLILAVVLVGGASLMVKMAPQKKPSAGGQLPAGIVPQYPIDEKKSPTPTTQSAPVKPADSAVALTKTTPVEKVSATDFTLAQVATHRDATSCWSAVNGGVYDLTSWISGHPGGADEILGICGKDGSADFNDQHGDKAKIEKLLATFKIGTLK